MNLQLLVKSNFGGKKKELLKEVFSVHPIKLLGSVVLAFSFFIASFLFTRMYLENKEDVNFEESETIKIEGRSMEPLIRSGQLVQQIHDYYKLKGVGRGDIVTFKIPQVKKLLIKKVVAIPGDKIELVNKILIVNEEPVRNSQGLLYELKSDYLEALLNMTPTVPEGMVLVLADRFRGSMDSSKFGFVPIRSLVGKVILSESADKLMQQERN